MTQLELNALVNSLIIDNNINQVTPAKVRSVFLAVIDSIQQTNLNAVTATSPLNYDAFLNVFTIIQSTASTNGYLSAADWAVFNAKQPLLVSGTNIKTINGTSLLGSGDISISGPANTDTLTEGSTNLYFTTARVLATLLTGISFATGGAIVSTDTVLVAFGKIQKQITDIIALLSYKLANNADQTAVTGTTATVLAVGSLLIPVGIYSTNTFAKLIIRARRTVSVSGNTSVLPYLSPNSGITAVTDPTLVALNQMFITGVATVAQSKSEIFIKNGTNLTELVNYVSLNDDTLGTDLRARTTIDWGVNQYLYIFVQNNQTTTSTVISGYKFSRE